MQGSLLQVDIAEIVVHEADEPYAVVGLLDADILAGEDRAEIDLSPFESDAAAGGDGDCLVMEGIFELGQAMVGAR